MTERKFGIFREVFPVVEKDFFFCVQTIAMVLCEKADF